MNLLARLDPGDPALWGAATSLVIVTVAAIGSEGLARAFRGLGASGRHDLYLAGLLVILLSPWIVAGVARSGLTLYRWPTASPPPEVALAPPLIPPRVDRPAGIEVDAGPIVEREAVERIVNPPPSPIVPRPIIDEAPEVVSVPGRGRAWAGLLVAAWGLGLAWHFARLARGLGSLWALGRRSRPIAGGAVDAVLGDVRRALGMRALPPILEASGVPGPQAGGMVRPMVVLPVGMAGTLGAAGLRDVLIHECAHVCRRDPLVGLLQRVASAVFWPHPLVHRLNARLARAREEACDDAVLRLGDPCGYARTLLLLAERGGSTRGNWAVVGLFETRWGLAERVAGILERGKEPEMRYGRWMKRAGVAALALASVAVAAIRPGEAPSIEAQGVAEPPPIVEGVGSVIDGQVVDEAGAPVAGASVNVTWFRKAKEDARTGADGRFRLAIPGPIRPAELVVASVDDKSRLGLTRREEPHGDPVQPIRIVLKPARIVTVKVVDATGQAVEGAAVEVESQDSGPIARGETDPAGSARFNLPADAEIDTVVALKDGVGFDYFENYRSWPSSRRDPLPADVALVLDGATSASVLAVDSTGRPTPGVPFRPMLIGKPGKLAEFNASGSDIASATTGLDGMTRFGWLPTSLSGTVSVEPWPWVHHCPVQSILKMGGLANARVLRTVRLAGRVTNADGSAAPGLLIQAESRGKPGPYGRGLARTGDDGTYAVTMPPDQVAMIAVVDPNRAARDLTGIAVREGQPRANLDLRLVEGARFVARITDEATGRPIPGFPLSILHRGIKVPEEFAGPHSTSDRQDLVTWEKADAEGRIELRLAPGDYTIVGHENLHVEGIGDITRDYRERPETGEMATKPLNGRVHLAGRANPPVAGALVRFLAPRGQPMRDINAVADALGRFQVEASRIDGGLLVARSRDGRVAGYRLVDKAGVDVAVEVAPAVTASGRVVGPDGRPVVGRPVQFSMTIATDPLTTFRAGDSATTDAEGRYHFDGLIPETKGEVMVPLEDRADGGGRVSVKKFDVNGPDPIAIPDVAFPGEPARLPPAAEGPKFFARDVVGANFLPYANTPGGRRGPHPGVEVTGDEVVKEP